MSIKIYFLLFALLINSAFTFGKSFSDSSESDSDSDESAVSVRDFVSFYTRLGSITGKIKETEGGRKYSAFTNIPYANIVQRFQRAKLVENFPNGYLDATKPQIACTQVLSPLVNASQENCLTLNVYTPYTHAHHDKLVPVLVFLHGGSFIRWSGNMFDPYRLFDAEGDTIFISINYRLGLLGYLSMGNDDAPGNMGLYDQISALQWIQNNIKSFGGDPSRVTIAGQSAGAASVLGLFNSPLAGNLFRSGIAESGDIFDLWAVNPNYIKDAIAVANYFKCTAIPIITNIDLQLNSKQIINCLNKQPAEAFLPLVPQTYPAPVVQNYQISIPKALPVSPTESLVLGSQAHLPLLFGANKDDGTFLLARTYAGLKGTPGGNPLDNPIFLQTAFLPALITSWGLADNPPGTFAQIINTYFTPEVIASGLFSVMEPSLARMYTGMFFKEGALKTAQFHSMYTNQTFLYSFDYYGDLTLYPYIGGVPEIERGVTHCDEFMYIFNYGPFTKPSDQLISNFMVQSWVNFVTNSDPNIKPNQSWGNEVWPKFSPTSQKFLRINEVLTVGENYHEY